MDTIHIPAGESIDPYLLLHRRPTRFVLEDGDYATRGAWGFMGDRLDCCMIGAGSLLEGAGSNRSLVRLQDPVTPPGMGYFEALTGGSRSGQSTSLTVQGLTLDVSAATMPVVSLHLWSDEPVVHDVVVTGTWGDRQAAVPGWPSEGFGILLNRAGISRRDGGGRISSCQVIVSPNPRDAARENYTCAIYLGIVRREKAPCMRSHLVDCQVVGHSGTRLHTAFAANDNTDARDCSCDGSAVRSWFCDTAGGEGIRISSCRFEAAYAGIDLKNETRDAVWRGITITDCEFSLNGFSGMDHVVGLVLDDLTAVRPMAGLQAEFRSVWMQRCRLVNRSNLRGFVAGLSASKTSDCGLLDCQLVGKWEPAVRCQGIVPEAWNAVTK